MVAGPAKMIIVPPRHYCIVHNPVVRSKPKEEGQFLGELQFDSMGQIRLQHAEKEVRLAQDPFPLYPGEEAEAVKQLTVVPAMQALRLKAVRDFEDEEDNVKRIAGDEFLFEGPGTYIPRREVEVVTTITATVSDAEIIILSHHKFSQITKYDIGKKEIENEFTFRRLYYKMKL